jgi:predicted transcriptional regulator
MAVTATRDEDAIARVLRLTLREKLREDLARRDKLRAVREATELGVTQVRLADVLGVTQPAVTVMLKRQPVSAPLIPVGHSGATPYEVAERYAAGLIDREQMRAELGGWDYAPLERPAGLGDDISVVDPQSFDGVEMAVHQGLIDLDDYGVIAKAYETRVLAGELRGVIDAH